VACLRTVLAALCLVAASAGGANAQDASTVVGTNRVMERGGIEVVGEVIFQNVTLAPGLQLGPLTSTGSANVTAIGRAGEAVSVAAPDSIFMVRAGGLEMLIAIMTSEGAYAEILGLDTLLAPGGILSVDLGGEISAGTDQLTPGEYQGLMVVVVQYN
jgi:hypothetical protein